MGDKAHTKSTLEKYGPVRAKLVKVRQNPDVHGAAQQHEAPHRIRMHAGLHSAYGRLTAEV